MKFHNRTDIIMYVIFGTLWFDEKIIYLDLPLLFDWKWQGQMAEWIKSDRDLWTFPKYLYGPVHNKLGIIMYLSSQRMDQKWPDIFGTNLRPNLGQNQNELDVNAIPLFAAPFWPEVAGTNDRMDQKWPRSLDIPGKLNNFCTIDNLWNDRIQNGTLWFDEKIIYLDLPLLFDWKWQGQMAEWIKSDRDLWTFRANHGGLKESMEEVENHRVVT